MPWFVDQLDRRIELQEPPKRIVSVVPSQTELLFHLGLEDRVAGITKFCIHPNRWFQNKTRVGGTKKLNFETIKNLNPDLIIANKEENTQEEIEALSELYPVWISDIYDINDAFEMMKSLGRITQTREEANSLIHDIIANFSLINEVQAMGSCIYLIWKSPYMSAGSDTYINDLLKRCGFHNLVEGRYPELSIEKIKALNPDHILLSSEPYPFKEKHIQELQTICPKAKITLVDGEFFSWYGSRLLGAPSYFKGLIEDLN